MYMFNKGIVYSGEKYWKYSYREVYNMIATGEYDVIIIEDISKQLDNGSISRKMLDMLLDNCIHNNVEVIFVDEKLNEIKEIIDANKDKRLLTTGGDDTSN